MGSNEKTGEAAKRALVSLRKALGKTQQTFAVEILKTAVATVARYETSNPPRGDVLLRLSNIAADHRQLGLSDEFLCIYLDQVLENVARSKTTPAGTMFIIPENQQRESHGYLLLKLEGQQQVDDAMALMQKRRGPVSDGTEQTRKHLDAMASGRRGLRGQKK